MAKQWKPGQLVTIKGNVYRITKDDEGCFFCAFRDCPSTDYPCDVCVSTIDEFSVIPQFCNFKLVKLCTKQDK